MPQICIVLEYMDAGSLADLQQKVCDCPHQRHMLRQVYWPQPKYMIAGQEDP